jgi:large subunit ribosomal protein L6
MSRVGRSPLTLPKGVTVEPGEAGIKVKGPKGELVVPSFPGISLRHDDNTLHVERAGDARSLRALHGLVRALLANAVQGVSGGFVRELEIQGIGYRASLKGKSLELTLGFSHPVSIEPPAGLSFEVPEPTKIRVLGIDKQAVGQVAANLRALRPPDAYHGKGIRYAGERVRLKPGKSAGR